jgi:GT2 family glycosyltransferase
MVDISAVILTSDIVFTMLLDCINSVQASSVAGGLNTEIIVVDNASHSRVCDWVAREFPSLTVLRFDDPVGFPTGNNAGYRISTGRYLLQLNNDTIIHGPALRLMVDFMEAHPDAGALGPRLMNADGTLQIGYYARSFPTVVYDAFHLFWVNRLFRNNPSLRHQMLLNEEDVTREVDQPAGASLFYRREVLFSIGLLDEDYTFAFDDVDVCFRIWRAGWKIFYLKDAEVTHFGGVTLGKSTAKMTHFYLNGLLTFYKKNRDTPASLLMRFLVLVSILFRIPVILVVTYIVGKRRWRGNAGIYLHYLLIVSRSLFVGYRPQILPTVQPTIIGKSNDRIV